MIWGQLLCSPYYWPSGFLSELFRDIEPFIRQCSVFTHGTIDLRITDCHATKWQAHTVPCWKWHLRPAGSQQSKNDVKQSVPSLRDWCWSRQRSESTLWRSWWRFPQEPGFSAEWGSSIHPHAGQKCPDQLPVFTARPFYLEVCWTADSWHACRK